jgi:glycosyltransferase involved in cell wall biosynthesis
MAEQTGKEPRTALPATVLYLHSSDDLYGADVILLQIVTGLDRTRFTPIVVLPDDMQHVGLLSAELAARGIESMHLPIAIARRKYFQPSGLLRFLGKLVRGTWAIRRLAKERNVRLIHGFTFAVISAPIAASLLRLPLVMHAHEIILRPRLLRKLLHFSGVCRSQRVICVSNATRSNIVEDQPAAVRRIQVIHNGIECPAFPLTKEELRKKLGVPLDKPLVGMIGRVSAWKGQEVLLEAAAIVTAANPDCHFISIGGVFDKEVQFLERLKQLHQELHLEQSFTLQGFMSDARDMLPAFDIFVSPSTSPDPFPTVVLEAMCAALPVIASAHGGPLEMVVEGETGLLFTPRDPAALAAAILELLADEPRRKRMGQAGRMRLQERFSPAPFLKSMQQVYQEALDEAPPVIEKG